MLDVKSLIGLIKGKTRIGLDIGSYYVKVVQLEVVNDRSKLIKKNILDVSGVPKSELSGKLHNFLQKKGYMSSGVVSVNIESPSLLIRRMDLPKMPERDLLTAIRWNFREHVDGAIDDYVVSYTELRGVSVAGKVSYCSYCIARKEVENFQAILAAAGIKTSSIEPNATALLSAFNYTVRWDYDKFYVILDMGYSMSRFVVIGNGCLMFSRPLGGFGLKKLFSDISKVSTLNEKEFFEKCGQSLESWDLKDFGVSPDDKEAIDKTKEAISQFVSQMIVEVQRSIDAFCLMFQSERVDKMFLCGGGTIFSGIEKRFANALGMSVEFFDPFSKILDVDASISGNLSSIYTIAVGLALPRK